MILFIFVCLSANAQKVADDNRAIAFGINYGGHLSGGDLNKRFGPSFGLGISLDYIFKDRTWNIGWDGQFIFGGKVKEPVLAQIVDENDYIIGNNSAPALVVLKERGWQTGVHIGKVFDFDKSERQSGLFIQVGVGYLQHKIKIEDSGESAVQLFGKYRHGYDRLTNGVCLTQFVGYKYMDTRGRMNFIIGFDFVQGITKSTRLWNFDTNSADTSRRIDLLSGIKIGWILPIYFGGNAENIYY